MSDACTGEIRIFAGTYAPLDWHICDGTLVSASTYPGLYSLIGNTYGGTLNQNFALPDLRGRLPMSQGTGKGLTSRTLGQALGTETVALVEAQLPAHTHTFMALNGAGTAGSPAGAVFANSLDTTHSANIAAHYLKDVTEVTQPYTLNLAAVEDAGGTAFHANVMPCVALNYIICLNGIYPNFN